MELFEQRRDGIVTAGYGGSGDGDGDGANLTHRPHGNSDAARINSSAAAVMNHCNAVPSFGPSNHNGDVDHCDDPAAASSACSSAAPLGGASRRHPEQNNGGSLVSTSTDEEQFTVGQSCDSSSTTGTARPDCYSQYDHPFHDDIVDDGQRSMMDVLDDGGENEWNEFRQTLSVTPEVEGGHEWVVFEDQDDLYLPNDHCVGDPAERPPSPSSISSSSSSSAAPSPSVSLLTTWSPPSSTTAHPSPAVPSTGHLIPHRRRHQWGRRQPLTPPNFLPTRIRQELHMAATAAMMSLNGPGDGDWATHAKSLRERTRNLVSNLWMTTLTGLTEERLIGMIATDDGDGDCTGHVSQPQPSHLPMRTCVESSLATIQSYQDLLQSEHRDVRDAWMKTELLLEFVVAAVGTVQHQDRDDPHQDAEVESEIESEIESESDDKNGSESDDENRSSSPIPIIDDDDVLHQDEEQNKRPQPQWQRLRRRQRPPRGTLNYVHIMVQQGYPTVLVWLACKLYPQQIQQSMAGGNQLATYNVSDVDHHDDDGELPLHHAAIPSHPLRHHPSGIGIAVSHAFQRKLPPGVVLQRIDDDDDDDDKEETGRGGSRIATNHPTNPAPLTSLQFLIHWYPQATKVVNARGLLPLHSYLMQTFVASSSPPSSSSTSPTQSAQPTIHPFDVRDLEVLVATEPQALRTRSLPPRPTHPSRPSLSSTDAWETAPKRESLSSNSPAIGIGDIRPTVVFPFLMPTDLMSTGLLVKNRSIATDREVTDAMDQSNGYGTEYKLDQSPLGIECDDLETNGGKRGQGPFPVNGLPMTSCLTQSNLPDATASHSWHGPRQATDDAINAMYVMIRNDPAVLQVAVALGDAAARQRIAQQQYPIGTKVEKYFDMNGRFHGQVVSYDHDSRVYRVQLEDGGDVEECREEELGSTSCTSLIADVDGADVDGVAEASATSITTSITTSTGNSHTTWHNVTTALEGADDEGDDVDEAPLLVRDDEHQPLPKSKFAPGTRVLKHFVGYGWYRGQVVSYDATTGLHGVIYHDGDEEDCDEQDLAVIAWDREGMKESEDWLDENIQTRILQTLEDGGHRLELGEAILQVLDGVELTQEEDQQDEEQSRRPKRPRFKIGAEVEKEFPGYGTFHGEVVAYDGKDGLYKVVYDDGDEEEYDEIELEEILVNVVKTCPRKKKKKKKRARRHPVNIERMMDASWTPNRCARYAKKRRSSR